MKIKKFFAVTPWTRTPALLLRGKWLTFSADNVTKIKSLAVNFSKSTIITITELIKMQNVSVAQVLFKLLSETFILFQ